MADSPHQATRISPILAVADIRRSIAYYTATLEFTDPWTWQDPPRHGGVRFGGAEVQLSHHPELARRAEGMELYFFIEEIDRWFELHRSRGAEILLPLEAKPWGMREYTLRDPDGYRLRFGEGGSDRTPPAQDRQIPAGVEIVFETPSLEDYTAMVRLMGWESFTNFDLLPSVLKLAECIVVARLHGRFIGMAVLTSDHAGTYYVRDVMVHPDHHAVGIGTAMMRKLIDHFHRCAPPKSMVFLLTGRSRSKFYEQFGFVGGDRGLWGMSMARK